MNANEKKQYRKEFDRLLTKDQRTLMARLQVVQDMVEKLWRWDQKRLEGAESELAVDLEVFGHELDDNPTFKKMPPLKDNFDYV